MAAVEVEVDGRAEGDAINGSTLFDDDGIFLVE